MLPGRSQVKLMCAASEDSLILTAELFHNLGIFWLAWWRYRRAWAATQRTFFCGRGWGRCG